MKKVIFSAPVLINAGYGTHSRQIAKWLIDYEEKNTDKVKVFFENVPWGICPHIVNPNLENGLIGKIMQRMQKSEDYDVSIQCKLPSEFDPFMATHNIGVTAGVETSVCNPTWVDAINRMDALIVPSEFVKNTFQKTGEVTVPVHVIAESFFDEILQIQEQNPEEILKNKLVLQTNFNFLLVGQFTGNNAENDRKNIAYTIKWICEEFKDNEDVGLIIKTNSGRQTKRDRQNCLSMLSQIIFQVKKGKGPKIYLLHGMMTNKEIAALYKHPKIKALVSLTHGEGWNLTGLEAAASGLPVMVTNWSAHTEYLNNGKWMKIDYRLGPIHDSRVDNNIFMKDSQWAFPDENDFKRKIKKFYNSSEIPKQWANELRNKILEKYSSNAISSDYTKVLENYLIEQ